MAGTISLLELRQAGIHLTADEAVAIALQLIHRARALQDAHAPEPQSGSPSFNNVFLSHDGSAYCCGYHATPAVSEVAILLQSLLPQGTAAPGALRYTIARALLEVDAPPFDSIQEFSDALARFERHDRATLIRGVIDRWRQAALVFPAALDRRRSALASDLRRHLREADARLYQHTLAAASAIEPRAKAPVKRIRFVPAIGACLAAGTLLIAAGDLMHGDGRGDVALPTAAPPKAGARAAGSGLQLPEPPGVAPQAQVRREIVKRPARLVRSSEPRTDRSESAKRGRRPPARSVLEKLRLQWLKNAFTGHPAPL